MNAKEVIKDILRPFKRFATRFQTEYTIDCLKTRHSYKSRFAALKDIHKGKRCFIIGNGPSLTAEDLTLLKDEYTFAANRVFYIYSKTLWRPTYYCCQDEVVFKDIANKIPSFLSESEYGFFSSYLMRFCKDDLAKNDKAMFFYSKFSENHSKVRFSECIDSYVYDGGTITYAAMQLAAYMGFSEIYLIGVDNNYSASSFKGNNISGADVKASYFEGMPTDIKMTKPRPEASVLSFLVAKEYADSHDIFIGNATRGGKLEVFPRVVLEDVLKKKNL